MDSAFKAVQNSCHLWILPSNFLTSSLGSLVWLNDPPFSRSAIEFELLPLCCQGLSSCHEGPVDQYNRFLHPLPVLSQSFLSLTTVNRIHGLETR